ncbi:hypothetical protein B0H19DRAFT_1242741 [Mycena capillaripes]|nr:hypothetical protein B0H19DRAFT_1242741 [Mycena capillaripes]
MVTFPKHEYTLRLGSVAPDFEAETTIGPSSSTKCVLFSQPGGMRIYLGSRPESSNTDKNIRLHPMCTTELSKVACRVDDFAQPNAKVIGISANNLDDHKDRIQDINVFGGKVRPTDIQFYAGDKPCFETCMKIDKRSAIRRPYMEYIYLY